MPHIPELAQVNIGLGLRIFARRYSFGRIVEKDEGMGLGVFDSAGVEG